MATIKLVSRIENARIRDTDELTALVNGVWSFFSVQRRKKWQRCRPRWPGRVRQAR